MPRRLKKYHEIRVTVSRDKVDHHNLMYVEGRALSNFDTEDSKIVWIDLGMHDVIRINGIAIDSDKVDSLFYLRGMGNSLVIVTSEEGGSIEFKKEI